MYGKKKGVFMKKIIVCIISFVLLMSVIPWENQALAATKEETKDSIAVTKSSSTAQGGAEKNLEEALKAVKKLITIPKDYSNFDYYYNQSSIGEDATWTFTWSNPKNYSYIYITCDSKYRLITYSINDYSKTSNGVAKYLKDELKKTADDFIKKVAPSIVSSLVFVDSQYVNIYSGNYTYTYYRQNNGVIFPDNSVSVSVNSVSGAISDIYINWAYDQTVPSSKVNITKEEASNLIASNMKMKLVYRKASDYLYSSTKKENKAFLVYVPSQDYISVNAKTKEVYHSRNEWNFATIEETAYRNASKADMDSGSSANGSTLTEEEIAKIDELKNLISQADAIKKITSNSYLYLEKTLTSYTATLQKSGYGNEETSYTWNIVFTDPRPVDYEKEKDTYRAYAYARVDAQTGKILEFSSSIKSNYDHEKDKWNTVKIAYDKEKSKEIFEKFAKAQIPERIKNAVLVQDSNDYVAYYDKNNEPHYGGYLYQYYRVNEGVEYSNNTIYGAVDGVSGKIYSFNSYWENNIVFESPKGAMSPEDAMKAYLSLDGYGLKYEINDIYTSSNQSDPFSSVSKKTEIRLVYRPDISPALISPFTGKQLDYSGKEYAQNKPYVYQDISNTAENRNILLLADMNIGFEGDKFLPDQKVTLAEVNNLIYQSSYLTYTGSDKVENLITKENLTSLLIKHLGLEKLAQLQNIYTTGYNDESSINKKNIGAVALAKGLGLIKGDGNNNFNPQSTITRREVVEYLISFINLEQERLYY